MYPDTRARTSTDSTASMRPVNSSESDTGRSIGWLTDTSGGGRDATGCAPPPQPARPAPIALTSARKAVTPVGVTRVRSRAACTARLQAGPPLRGSAVGRRSLALFTGSSAYRQRSGRATSVLEDHPLDN